MKQDRPLTTGDIAKYCSVTVATVCNWVKAAKLEVFVTPGGQYRMERDKFLAFLHENGFPIPQDLADQTTTVLTIDPTQSLTPILKQGLDSTREPYEIHQAGNAYEALLKIGQASPNFVVISDSQQDDDTRRVVHFLRSNPSTRGIKFIVAGNQIVPASGDLFDASLKTPFEMQDLQQVFLKKSA